MNNLPSEKNKWVLTQGVFDKLLRWLDPDRERAGAKYETIRYKLIKFFEWRGGLFPEEYADETIDRVARKMDQGETIRASEPYSYFYGVARMLFMEVLRAEEKARTALDQPKPPQPLLEEGSEKWERQRECLERCMRSLPSESRELIIRYHRGEKGAKIENRQKLAEQLKIPLNALRIRCHRIRDKLEACVENCLKQVPAG